MVDINEAILTRRYVKRLINAMNAIGYSMEDDELMSVKIFNNTILLESDNMSTIIKLEEQE